MSRELYIFWFLHQTTTIWRAITTTCVLYIFWFLHQTTTVVAGVCSPWGCISFDSYIKPQLPPHTVQGKRSCISFDSYIKPQLTSTIKEDDEVVYLLIPTSNHNLATFRVKRFSVVYLLIPTSNHNVQRVVEGKHVVVYLLIPTSNHNVECRAAVTYQLYIFWFLHQTTTSHWLALFSTSCISFDSYIKPQRWVVTLFSVSVVYLLIPTSNHNVALL